MAHWDVSHCEVCEVSLGKLWVASQLRQYDEWLGADRLRSKAIVPKSKGSQAAFGAVMPQAAKKLLLVKPKAGTWWQNSGKTCNSAFIIF